MYITARIEGIEPDRLYTVQEVARCIGRSSNLLYGDVSSGRIRSEKVGHARVIRGRDIIPYVELRLTEAAPNVRIEAST